ncbi:aminotransferase class IV [Candidatus Peregrinibacteria bacterium]|nr:MAG: aminotransferase class IV [Candidatus Peregrinibacteria bacterium]
MQRSADDSPSSGAAAPQLSFIMHGPEQARVVDLEAVRRQVQALFERPDDFSGLVFEGDAANEALSAYDELAGRAHRLGSSTPTVSRLNESLPHGGRVDELAAGDRLHIFHTVTGEPVRPNTPDPSLIDRFDSESLPFASVATDVMGVALFDATQDGWTVQMMPHGKMPTSPWDVNFHYGGDNLITGMTYYRFDDGVYTLMPKEHFERAASDAKRLGSADLGEEMLMEMAKRHLEGDRRWVPKPNEYGNRYYHRFTSMPQGEGPKLYTPNRLVYSLGSPVGPYKVAPDQKASLLVMPGERPVVAGLGSTKYGGAYAEAVRQFMKAEGPQNGFHEPLYVTDDGRVQEGASMTIGAIKGNTIHFPEPNDANTLPGITAMAVMRFAEKRGMNVVYDQPLYLSKMAEADAVIATGTAMGVRQIGLVNTAERKGTLSNGNPIDHREGGIHPLVAALQDDYENTLRRDPRAPFKDMMVKIA